jgi:hypothetical protein
MRKLHVWAALVAVLWCTAPLPGETADLAKVDRGIGKEPAYQGKPAYCLLVFGNQGTRVWMVRDGHRVYVDANANGDLTDSGEMIDFKAKDQEQQRGGGAVTVTDPATKNKYALSFSEYGTSLFITCGGEGRRTQWGGSDCDGEAAFTAKREDAPVIHFDGPLTIGWFQKPVLKKGEECELAVLVGSKGVGKGAFVSTSYAEVKEDQQPEVELTFPPATPGGTPVKVKATLTKRC